MKTKFLVKCFTLQSPETIISEIVKCLMKIELELGKRKEEGKQTHKTRISCTGLGMV